MEKEAGEDDDDKYFLLDEDNFDNYWSSLGNRVEKKTFTDHEEDISKFSVILKSFRNEYETDSLLSEPTIKLLKEKKIKIGKKCVNPCYQKTSEEVLIPGYNPNSFIPNTSSLSYGQIMVCQTFLKSGAHNKEQMKLWTKYQAILKEEQQHYMEFAREQWAIDGIKKRISINPEVKELTDLLWQVRIERVYQQPRLYVQKENISLTVQQSKDTSQQSIEEVQLSFVKKLHSIGATPRYYIPDLWTFFIDINSVCDTLKKPTLGWSQLQEGTKSYYKEIHPQLLTNGYHPDVSKDEIAIRLAKENSVNIVMSSSAFLCLIDNRANGVNSNWDLPVTVIEYQSEHGIKRIAFIDKKLPPISMTTFDRAKNYSKIALKMLFAKMKHPYRDPRTTIYDADAIETFGVDCPDKKSIKNLKKVLKTKCTYCKQLENNMLEPELVIEAEVTNKMEDTSIKTDICSDSEDTMFFIDTEDELDGDKNMKNIENGGDIPSVSNTEENCVDAEKQKNNLCFCTYNWIENEEDITLNKSTPNFKVTYNLWDFKSSASENYMSKHCSKNLKVLIRTKIDGKVLEKDINQLKSVRYKLSPKLEYQTEFGAEAATLSETLRDWASLLIRPDNILARVRFDALKGELIQIQQMTCKDLIQECQRLHKISPTDRLVIAHSILVKLSDLIPGIYIIDHKQQYATFVNLYKSVRSGSQIYNLHLQYKMVDTKQISPQSLPYTPLDETIVTPTFQRYKRIPCTFVPKRNKSQRSLLKDNTAINPQSSNPIRKKKKKKKKI